MVAGRLQEKNGFYYIVLSYTDSAGKRRQPWIGTGLPVKGNKKRAEKMLADGRIVFPLYHILIVLSVVVSIRPRFPFQKFFLAGKVLASQADDDFIGIHINDGIGVFLIQRIDAFSIKHFVPPFRSE